MIFVTENRKTKSQIYINNMISNNNLIDTWRMVNPTQECYTWSQKQPPVKCRLDYFLVPVEFNRYTISTKIKPSIKTDHKCVDLKIEIDKYVRGPGMWKINNSILLEEAYKTKIQHVIQTNWTESQMDNIAARFDYLKYKIRQATKQYCKSRTKKHKLKEKELLNSIELLEDKHQQRNLTRNEEIQLENSRIELEHMLEHKARGAWVRSRVQHIEQNEKSNAFFTLKLKKTMQRKQFKSSQKMMR